MIYHVKLFFLSLSKKKRKKKKYIGIHIISSGGKGDERKSGNFVS